MAPFSRWHHKSISHKIKCNCSFLLVLQFAAILTGSLIDVAIDSEIFASFGGLLMSLKGDPRQLQKIELDLRLYLLARKVVAA
jgi:hypothetical protein